MKRPDASMELLREISTTALDPDYLDTTKPRSNPRVMALAVLLVTAVIAVAGLTTAEESGKAPKFVRNYSPEFLHKRSRSRH